MAAGTYTATDTPNAARLVEISDTFARASFNLNGSGSLSASDIVYMARIPTGVRLIDGYISGTTGGQGTVWKVGVTGINGTDTILASALTLSDTAQMKRFDGGSMPFKVSVSDDAVQRFAWVYLTRTSGTSTATASIQLVVNYAPVGAI